DVDQRFIAIAEGGDLRIGAGMEYEIPSAVNPKVFRETKGSIPDSKLPANLVAGIVPHPQRCGTVGRYACHSHSSDIRDAACKQVPFCASDQLESKHERGEPSSIAIRVLAFGISSD